jgi:uncharacterized protein YuzE
MFSPASCSSQRRDQSCEVNMAHTTEFPLATGPISRPVDFIRLLAKGGLPLKIARSVVERLAAADIKGRYDHERDSLYIEIAQGPSAETREMPNGLKVDLDPDGNVIGFDVDNSSPLGALLRDFVASGATLEDLARAWASLDGERDEFAKEKDPGPSGAAHGHYLGYLAAAGEVLRRAAKHAREPRSISSGFPANPAPPPMPAETSDPGPRENGDKATPGPPRATAN